MNILVTGSSGRIGHYVMRDLRDAGHRALGVDVVAGPETHMRVDLTQSGEIVQALAKAQAEDKTLAEQYKGQYAIN